MTSGDSGAGVCLKKLPYTSREQREMDMGEGRGLLGGEYRRRKEKNVIGEEENGTLLFLPATSFPSFLWMDDSSPLKGGAEFTLGPTMHIGVSSLPLNVSFSYF